MSKVFYQYEVDSSIVVRTGRNLANGNEVFSGKHNVIVEAGKKFYGQEITHRGQTVFEYWKPIVSWSKKKKSILKLITQYFKRKQQ